LGTYLFYNVYRDDYRFHLRNVSFKWSLENLQAFWSKAPVAFGHLVPTGVVPRYAVLCLGLAFGSIITLLVIRRQFAGAFAGFAALALVIISFASSRIEGDSGVTLSMSRMYLSIPVLAVWLLALTPPTQPRPKAAMWRAWLTSCAFIAVTCIALMVARHKAITLPNAVSSIMRKGQESLTLVSVEDALRVAAKIQAAADANHASIVLIGKDSQAHWNYLLPLLTTCETLYPAKERRTWRLHEEQSARHQAALTMDLGFFHRAQTQDYANARIVAKGPLICTFDMGGRSIIKICEEMNAPVRPFLTSRQPAGSIR